MSTSFVLQATLQLPPDDGLPVASIAASVSSTFDSKADYELKLTGSGTHTLGLGTLGAPGLKGLLIAVNPSTTAAPINVRFNAADEGGAEISPGGWLGCASPNPVTGITQVDIVYTTAVTVRIWAVG